MRLLSLRRSEVGRSPRELPVSPLAIVVPGADANDANFIVEPGEGYDGVVLLTFPDGGICTGALLATGRHILTAAHCFEVRQQTSIPNLTPSPDDVKVFFDLPGGRVERAAKAVFVHPEWDNTENYNNDLAAIELAQAAPPTAERYPLYRRQDEVGQTMVRVGYGVRGTGRTGEDASDPTTIKRFGMNRYDTLGETLNAPPLAASIRPGTQLVYDFDNGLRRHDALGVEYGIHDLGIVEQAVVADPLNAAGVGRYVLFSLEVGTSTGDSGGPSFIRGRIAGIASNGYSPETPGVDVTEANDTSFGEYFFDTRVSAYLDFIEGVTGGGLNRAIATPDLLAAGSWGLSGLPLLLAAAIAGYRNGRRAIAAARQAL